MAGDCPRCHGPNTWNDDGTWRFDLDNGMTGPQIAFCPYCGLHFAELPLPTIERRRYERALRGE